MTERQRILIASPEPFTTTAGTGQTAQELAAALKRIGHEVTTWSPETPPPSIRSIRHTAWRIAQLQDFARSVSFDWIDVPPLFAAGLNPTSAPLVARSTQPDWLYFLANFRDRLRHPSPRQVLDIAIDFRAQLQARRGLEVASAILCLGSIERAWLRKARPGLDRKAGTYYIAPPHAERNRPRPVRSRSANAGHGHRFLWMGRWHPHKGTARLLAWARWRLTRHPCDRLTLAGTGRMLGPRELDGLPTDRVLVIPSFDRKQLEGLLVDHDAGLFTSRVEGWGLSLNEMLEGGLVTFATDAGGVPDLAPYFPNQLRRFPPPERIELGPPDPLAPYREFFDWDHLAGIYVEAILGALS